MVALPSQDLTADAIYQWYENQPEERREYLGGSQIGVECRRALWFSFRWVRQPSFPGRIRRLFETGHREEERIIANLRAIGCEVLDKNPSTGEQWEIVDVDRHLMGHADGAVLGLLESPKTWHLLECKTMNKRQFDELLKKGCRQAKPTHWNQCQLYMGGLGLKRCAYFVQCKDDDRLYMERIKYDAKVYKMLLLKARSIIYAESPPDRIGKDASFYLCKWCSFSDFCWGNGWPDVNCRTCAHSTPAADGKWECARSFETTDGGCSEHIFLPTLIHWAEPTDGDPAWVRYQAEGYGSFVNCAATGFPAQNVDCYSSAELRNGKRNDEVEF